MLDLTKNLKSVFAAKLHTEAKLCGLGDLTDYLIGAWLVSAACWH